MFTPQSALRISAAAGVIVLLITGAAPQAQQKSAAPKLTTPKEQFGHDIGDDYFLVNYTQYVDYLKKLDSAVRAHDGRGHRQDRRRPARVHRHHHVAREPPEAGA